MNAQSGFRETYGGIHLKYNIIPDIAVFGKQLEMVLPVNTIIGKKNYELRKKHLLVYFLTESVGIAASLATFANYEKNCSYEYVK